MYKEFAIPANVWKMFWIKQGKSCKILPERDRLHVQKVLIFNANDRCSQNRTAVTLGFVF